MPRIARFIEEKGFYHIISRSLNDAYILKDSKDFLYFLKLISEAKKQYPFYLFHYVIMNTHFHFIVKALSHELLSKGLAYIKWSYTFWCKKRHGWKGPLWRERYTSIPIENENYLYNCGMYIEYNPVRAKMCTNPADYKFSSCQKYYLGLNNDLLDNYEVGLYSNQYNLINYRSDMAKNMFSRSLAIGSTVFINKLVRNGCPKKPKK